MGCLIGSDCLLSCHVLHVEGSVDYRRSNRDRHEMTLVVHHLVAVDLSLSGVYQANLSVGEKPSILISAVGVVDSVSGQHKAATLTINSEPRRRSAAIWQTSFELLPLRTNSPEGTNPLQTLYPIVPDYSV